MIIRSPPQNKKTNNLCRAMKNDKEKVDDQKIKQLKYLQKDKKQEVYEQDFNKSQVQHHDSKEKEQQHQHQLYTQQQQDDNLKSYTFATDNKKTNSNSNYVNIKKNGYGLCGFDEITNYEKQTVIEEVQTFKDGQDQEGNIDNDNDNDNNKSNNNEDNNNEEDNTTKQETNQKAFKTKRIAKRKYYTKTFKKRMLEEYQTLMVKKNLNLQQLLKEASQRQEDCSQAISVILSNKQHFEELQKILNTN